MRWCRVGGRIAAQCLVVSFDIRLVSSAPGVGMRSDGRLAIGGRAVRCGSARNVLDPSLPNLGLAAPGVVVLNPRLLSRQSNTVRLFVYHHECGHHHVGGSEVAADCWAVRQGVRQGWLTRQSLGQICRSFGNGPATPTHPSGSSRCASLQQCFAGATAARTARREKASAARAPAAGTVDGRPRLVSGPSFVRGGKGRLQE
jgi:hypothetical protein